jgi:hypothetical protein
MDSAWIFTCGFVFRFRGECCHKGYVLEDSNVNPVLPLASMLYIGGDEFFGNFLSQQFNENLFFFPIHQK